MEKLQAEVTLNFKYFTCSVKDDSKESMHMATGFKVPNDKGS